MKSFMKKTDKFQRLKIFKQKISSKRNLIYKFRASIKSIPNPLRFGRPTDVGYHILINGESYFAPYKYRGNALDFRKVA